jgi:hypothetical protein
MGGFGNGEGSSLIANQVANAATQQHQNFLATPMH